MSSQPVNVLTAKEHLADIAREMFGNEASALSVATALFGAAMAVVERSNGSEASVAFAKSALEAVIKAEPDDSVA